MGKCLICSSDDLVSCFPKYGGEYLRCGSCGFLLSTLRDSAEQGHDKDSSFSDGSHRDLNFNLEVEYSKGTQKSYLKELKRFECERRLNRLLDVGCGTGGFLFAAKSRGWIAMGIEVSSQAAAAAKNRGLDARLGDINSLGLEPESLDLMRMKDVIEHLRDPLGTLGIAHRLLRRGGLLSLTTVNTGSYTYAILKDRWRYIDPRYHICLFSRNNIRALLDKAGFRVVSLKTVGVRSDSKSWFEKRVRVPFLRLVAKASGKGHRMSLVCVKD